MWSAIWQDAKYGVRTLAKAPGFTAVAVISLAIGIGLNSTIFTIIDSLLFRPLPYANPSSVVSIYTSVLEDRYGTSSYQDLKDIEASVPSLESVVGHSLMFAAINVTGDTRLALGEVVTANYFSAFGIPLGLGRGFSPEDEQGEGAHPVVVISDRLWRRGFNASPDAVGHTLTIKSRPYTIVGIAQPSFTGLAPGIAADLWVPISMVEDVEPAGQIDVVPSATGTTKLEQRGFRWLFLNGRMRDGANLAEVQANLDTVMAGLERDYPKSNTERRPSVIAAGDVRFHPTVDSYLRPAGAVLMGAVGLVLLIACANLASMLLARGASRTKEMALRSAIGASRSRLIRQMSVESVLIAMGGGAVGLLMSLWATSWVVAARLPIDLPISFAFAIDWRVVAFTGALSLLTGLAFGILPALKASRPDLVASLKDDASLKTPGRSFGLRHVLVVGQVAVAVVLIVSGLLMARSLFAGFRTDPGFPVKGLVTATVSMDMHGYDAPRAKVFFEQAVERVRRLPGVESVALAERLPFSPNDHSATIVVDGRPEATPRTGVSVSTSRVAPEYFSTLGVPIVQGRGFDTRDTPESARVAIISEAFAKTYFPNGDAVGRRLRVRDQSGPALDIIGISRDYIVLQVGEAPRPMLHLAASQQASGSYSFLVRTSADVNTLTGALQRDLKALEPQILFLEVGPLERMVATSMLPISLGASVFGGLAGLAMLLAGVGLYGVIAFSVSRRTREIGIRMALGSTRGVVVTQVLREALVLVAIGAVVGGGLAMLGAQALSSVLLVAALDPVSYLAAAVLLLTVTGLAAALPARRAASVDPLIALRTL